MSAKKRLPAYCLHKPSGQAFVRIRRRFYYLGPYDSPESRERWSELVEQRVLRADESSVEMLLSELVLLYLAHAKRYYRKNGHPTSEVGAVEAACRFLMPYRHRRAMDFGPRTLKAVREDMVAAGLARTTINAQVGRIRRLFRWAVAEQFVKPDVLVALAAVAPLRRGRTDARETPPVAPVADEHVEVVLPMLTPPLRAAVEVLRLTGARTGEILAMRVRDLDMGADPWEYLPRSHKTEHKGKSRVILLGPKAQDAIRPLLRADPAAYVFRPSKTGVRRYHKQAVRNAVRRVCRRINAEREREELPPIPAWHPHQLRHTAATRLRKEFGFDVAKTVLGHAKAEMTERYAERDLAAARRVVATVG